GPRPPRSQIRERGSLTPANHRPRLRLTSASFAGTSRPEGSGCIPPRALDLCCRSQKRGSLAQRNDVRQTRRWVRKTRILMAVYTTLARRVGVQHIEAVEDAVQSALMTALEAWAPAGLPDNPSAWLFRVAHNNLMGELRQRTSRRRILEQSAAEGLDSPENGPEILLAGEVRDDLLRMLFVCCD